MNDPVRFGAHGLVPAIAQDHLTGEVRMLAWMNEEALEKTLATGLATFFSRSRQALWVKGETSGNRLRVVEATTDCDQDAVLLLVEPEGPTCHTGRESCFFERLSAPEHQAKEAEGAAAAPPTENEAQTGPETATPFLGRLERVIFARQASTAARSYTRSLLDAGPPKLGEKLREEADELARAVADETPERVASEAADLLFHLMVALRARGVSLRAVLATLAAREGRSGHAEKASRTAPKA